MAFNFPHSTQLSFPESSVRTQARAATQQPILRGLDQGPMLSNLSFFTDRENDAFVSQAKAFGLGEPASSQPPAGSAHTDARTQGGSASVKISISSLLNADDQNAIKSPTQNAANVIPAPHAFNENAQAKGNIFLNIPEQSASALVNHHSQAGSSSLHAASQHPTVPTATFKVPEIPVYTSKDRVNFLKTFKPYRHTKDFKDLNHALYNYNLEFRAPHERAISLDFAKLWLKMDEVFIERLAPKIADNPYKDYFLEWFYGVRLDQPRTNIYEGIKQFNQLMPEVLNIKLSRAGEAFFKKLIR